VEVWDVARGQPVVTDFSAGRGQVLALAFTPGGKALASYDLDGSLDAWQLPSGNLLSNSALGDATQVNAAAFSPDTTTLAVGTDDGTVQLWDTGTDQKIGNPVAPGDGRIDSLAFDPGGKTLATGGGDGTVRMWDVSYLVDTVSQLCTDIGGSLSKADWEADLKASLPHQPGAPGLPYQKVCP
jgi:WD40 repeat protein